ncbi:hypothetical protein [Massilia sp. ST3]|uniref:hypothetical protein n=1 Tax=Massilia sp. ST3 TaxID=2824903 RepID=UPI001B82C4A0|nr:hypothetical protein [Massilia sp. ST3]MBQ5947070.1 hypothetical protein [Massilia sp. ST3]
MRAHEGLMARRAPGWPLAATLGAHLLLAWLWLSASAPRPEASDPFERVFNLVPVLRPPQARPPAPRLPSPPDPVRRPKAEALARPVAPTESVPPRQAPAAPDPAPYDDPLAERQPVPETGGSVSGQAVRQAGPVDQALREGKLAPLAPSASTWQRFSERLEMAHKDTSRTMTSESYTTPDGVTIYRFRRGSKVYCRTGGSVRPTPSALDYVRDRGGALQFDTQGGEGAAGMVPCPKYAEFKRD